MENSKRIGELTQQIGELESRRSELDDVMQNLEVAKNELINQIAASFVVLCHGSEVKLLGAAPQSETRYKALKISHDSYEFGGVRVMVDVCVGSVELFLKMGEHALFSIDRFNNGDEVTHYEIWVFDNYDEARMHFLQKKEAVEKH